MVFHIEQGSNQSASHKQQLDYSVHFADKGRLDLGRWEGDI